MLLANHFRQEVASSLGKSCEAFDEDAAAWLLQHRWPGNVRELQNVVERAVTLTQSPRISLKDLRIEFTSDDAIGHSLRPTLEELEFDYIRRVLEEAKGDKAAAARILGVSVRTLQRRFK